MASKNGKNEMVKHQDSDALAKASDSALSAFDATGADAAEMLENGGVLAESFLKLAEGDKVRGVFLGWGEPFDFKDEHTGEIRSVKSVILEAPNGKARARIMGNHELAAKLAKVSPGTEVFIQRGGSRDIGKGRRVSEFHVIIGKPTRAAEFKSLPARTDNGAEA